MSAAIQQSTVAAPSSSEPSRNQRKFHHVVESLGDSFAIFRNPKSIAGLSILLFFTLVALFAPIIAPYDPLHKDYTALLQAPSSKHLMGTTHMGEDLLSQIIWGTRGVLIVGFSVGVVATIISVIVGVTAGYVGGIVGEALSALTNVFLVIPQLPLLIIVSSQFDNPSILLISGVLSVTGWAWGARVLRAQTMSLRNRDFVQAARANGESLSHIIFVEMLPNLMSIIASSFVGTVNAAILNLTTLAFVGVIPITNLNWGTVLYWAQQNGAFPNYWWWYIPAGVCIALLAVALSLVNFGIDEYVNPRLRSAGERARAMRKKGLKPTSSVTKVGSISSADTSSDASVSGKPASGKTTANTSTNTSKA